MSILCANIGPYGGKRMEDVAEMDAVQLNNVFLRPGEPDVAEKGGYWPVPNVSQVSGDRYEAVGGSFDAMFKELCRWRGCSEEEIELRWREYVAENPQLGFSIPGLGGVNGQ